MPRRESRNKIKDSQYNVLVPIDISIFGTENDPCFGKHYDSAAKECGRCGDSQICQIITAQGVNNNRAKLESKTSFKDKQEIVEDKINLKDLSNVVVKVIEKRGPTSTSKMVRYIISNFRRDNPLDKDQATLSLRRIVKDHPNLVSYKTDGKRFIKWKK